MSYETININKDYDGQVQTIELNRPKFLNALNNQCLAEVALALKEADQDQQVKVVIIKGNQKAFAAGADLNLLSKATVVDHLLSKRADDWRSIASFSKPLIASVQGFALGAGLELALSCDFIICSDTAKFGQPELKVGTLPGGGGTQRLTKLLGKSLASYFIFTGEHFDATTAKQFGLVAKVCADQAIEKETLLIAKNISEKPPLSIKLAKDAINQSFETSLSQGLEFERRNFFLSFATKDQKEGANAFLEKRSPEYQGK